MEVIPLRLYNTEIDHQQISKGKLRGSTLKLNYALL